VRSQLIMYKLEKSKSSKFFRDVKVSKYWKGQLVSKNVLLEHGKSVDQGDGYIGLLFSQQISLDYCTVTSVHV
jgi:hypothetical protein